MDGGNIVRASGFRGVKFFDCFGNVVSGERGSI